MVFKIYKGKVNMKKQIAEFIRYNENNQKFITYLKKNISPLLKDYYYYNDHSLYFKLLEIQEKQSVLHDLMEDECNRLFDFCKVNEIEIIGLKGVFLEHQYWDIPRLYNDIDIIIRKDDIPKLYEYFSESGVYKLVKKRNINPFDKKPDLSKMLKINLTKNHHIVLWKESKIASESGINHIEIEIHGAFDTFKIVNIDDNKMFEDKTEFKNFYVLKPESQILFLIYHTIQHLPYIRHNLREMDIKLDRFVDVAQIIEKETINWEYFYRLCQIHSMYPLCSFYFKLFNSIFPNFIPQETLNKIDRAAEQSDFYWKNIYLRLMTLDPINIIIGDLSEFAEIQNTFNAIKSQIVHGRYSNPYILKFAMELWKFKLKHINKISKPK